MKAGMLEHIRGGLIVSVQAYKGSALDDPHVIAAMARAAQDNGAVAVRVQGVDHLRAVRARVDIPIIGLIKREYDGFAPYITPTLDEVIAIAATGADAIAYDATPRPRPGGVSRERIVEEIHRRGCLAMADCAQASDGMEACAAGANIVASTLCGYTKETAGHALPALDLVAALAAMPACTICEGGVSQPEQVAAALHAGASAVVVGTAITNVDWLVARFAGAAKTVTNR
jgi:N-acylglucosamine-6-phosphate 2-epimerase